MVVSYKISHKFLVASLLPDLSLLPVILYRPASTAFPLKFKNNALQANLRGTILAENNYDTAYLPVVHDLL